MARRRLRLGIRAQLTLMVLVAAILSTGATLFIAHNAIQNYAFQQAETQARESLSIATLIRQNTYGVNLSISSDGQMVLDSPKVGRDQGTSFTEGNQYGRYALNGDTEYVNSVSGSTRGAVSVYQCANSSGQQQPCKRIATTFPVPPSGISRDHRDVLCASVMKNLRLDDTSTAVHEWVGEDPSDDPVGCGAGYFGDYYALTNPQGQFIGVLYVGEPLDAVTSFETNTSLELLLLGVIVMTAGAVLALLFASAIVNALQRAARHVSSSSERIAGIAAQQSGGAAQQVWAVNAVNKALQNFQEMARDIAGRTDQLALMGNQIISRRSEISPAQIDSILAYMTRSVRDISVASRQQAAQFERMSGAMQAVIEIAEQVAGNSQQSSESAERLQLVVRQLQQLVGVSPFARRANVSVAIDPGFAGYPGADQSAGWRGQERRVAGARERGMRQLGPATGVGRQPAAVGASARYGQAGAYSQGAYGQGGGYQAAQYPPNGYNGSPGYSGYGGSPSYNGQQYGGYSGQGMMPGSSMAGVPQGMGGPGWAAPRSGSAMPGGMMPGMRAPATGPGGGEADWRLPPMPPLPAMQMPSMGAEQPGPRPSSFGNMNANGSSGNLPPGDADRWGAPDQGNDPRGSWTGER